MAVRPPPPPPLDLPSLSVFSDVYGAPVSSFLSTALVRALSPCVWGHLILPEHMKNRRGPIPMCMGPPWSSYRLSNDTWVYPQLDRDTDSSSPQIPRTLGLSTCVWRHHVLVVPGRVARGSV